MNVKAPAAAGPRFTLLSRLLHWSMAAMVIAQLFIGVTMVASLSYYPLLLAIHRPLGIAILAFAIVRLLNRIMHRPPPFLATMSPIERRIATWSEYLLYALFLAQPLIGWAMLSAAQRPIVLYGPIHLPGIAPKHLGVRGSAALPYDFRLFALSDLYRPHVRGPVSHVRPTRPDDRSHGIVAGESATATP